MKSAPQIAKMMDRPGEEISKIHTPFQPAEVYSGERIDAELQFAGQTNDKKRKLAVWRISPLGVELVIDPTDQEFHQLAKRGARINLWVRMREQICEFQGLVIGSHHVQEGRDLIGIRWCADPTPADNSQGKVVQLNRRKTERWLCGNDFMPTGIAPNTARFNDFIHFKVLDISGDGMSLLTSLRNRYLIPGMILDSSVSFPLSAQLNIRLRIVNSRVAKIQDREQLILGVKFVKRDRELINVIGQYIFQFGPRTTIEALRKAGFEVKNASMGLDFNFVRTEEDYKEVLELRRYAYQQAGKLPADATLEDVADIYDSRARIFTARYRGELIGSFRLTFHDPDDQFEIEDHVKLPAHFPRKEEAVEVTRLCTHPDFRQSDIFYALIRRAVLAIAQSKRRWIITFASPNLVSLYEKVGAKRTGVIFQHRGLANKEHEVITWDALGTITGKGLNPIIWNALCSDMIGYLEGHENLEFTPLMAMRIRFFQLFKPLTPIFVNRMRRQRS